MTSDVGFDRRELGDRLKNSREYLGYSQDEVASVVGLPRSAISLIESGQRKIDISELKRFSDLYEQSINYFTQEKISVEEVPVIRALARKASSLSMDDILELEQFADYLKTRAASKKAK